MRPFITALGIFLWLLLGWFLFQSSNECCESSHALTSEDEVKENVEDTGVSSAVAPLHFNWSESTPVTSENWEAERSKILNNIKQGQMLEITGLYVSDEENQSNYDNLGLARAHEVSRLFSPPMEASQIQLNAKSITVEAPGKGFPAWEYRIFTKTVTIDESIVDKVIIRFPFNSARRIADPEVEKYLDQMAQKVIRSGESLKITGFSDNIGPSNANLSVGLERANAVKDFLIGKGVQPSRIVTATKGQADPVGSNDTREGRALNRRTEVEIIK
ncbi:MAG TPA: OmpA family protein [Saprospiraceae bacterium]|nr:OmpA family protein [Saprospiraceae bacterium]